MPFSGHVIAVRLERLSVVADIRAMRSFLCVVLLLLALPAGAAADVREGRTDDPVDATLHENVDGSSYRDPDIELVAVRYDTAGSIQFHLRLYEAITDRNSLPSFRVCALDRESVSDGSEPACSYFGAKGDLSFSGSYSASSSRHFELEEYEGTIPATVNFSDDGRSVYIDGSHPALANRGYNAADSVVYRSDVATGFHLYGPGGFTRCSDGVDNDGDSTTDMADSGCDRVEDDDERLSRTPSMSRSQAIDYLERALTRHFGGAFRYRSGWRRACARTARTRFSCRVAWGVGDSSFRGVARLWHSREGEDATWNYAWRIVRTNEYCKFVLRRKRCTKVHVVR
jgi:hypothetical protein